MASNVQSNLGEDPIITEMRERCQSFVQEFKAGKEKFSTIQIWNKIRLILHWTHIIVIFAGSTAQRNNLFRLLLLSLANAEAQICLKSITGYRFIDGYLCKYSNGLQNLKLTEMHPSMIHEAYPIWFVRVAFVVLENMVYLLKCLSDITGPDGNLVFRPISAGVARMQLSLPDESVLEYITEKYDEEDTDLVKKIKRERDEKIKRARADATIEGERASKRGKYTHDSSESSAALPGQSSSHDVNASDRVPSMNQRMNHSPDSCVNMATGDSNLSSVVSEQKIDCEDLNNQNAVAGSPSRSVVTTEVSEVENSQDDGNCMEL
eukprot:623872_1